MNALVLLLIVIAHGADPLDSIDLITVCRSDFIGACTTLQKTGTKQTLKISDKGLEKTLTLETPQYRARVKGLIDLLRKAKPKKEHAGCPELLSVTIRIDGDDVQRKICYRDYDQKGWQEWVAFLH